MPTQPKRKHPGSACAVCGETPDVCNCKTHGKAKTASGEKIKWCKCRHRIINGKCTNAKCGTNGGPTGGRSAFGNADANQRKKDAQIKKDAKKAEPKKRWGRS